MSTMTAENSAIEIPLKRTFNLTTYFSQFSILPLYLLLSALLRLVLVLEYGTAENVSLSQTPKILLFGALQDLLAVLMLSLPVSLLNLLPDRILMHRLWRGASLVATFAIIFGIFFILPAEFLFFDEFTARFNLVAVDYFAYPTEVIGNIEESYPIGWLIGGILIVSAFTFRGIYRKSWSSPRSRAPWPRRVAFACVHLSVVILFCAFGSIDLLVSSSNRVQTEITQNGVLTFFRALRTNNIEFDHFYATADSASAFGRMRELLGEKGGEFVSSDSRDLRRYFPAKHAGLGKLNVIIVGEESLGAQYISALGDSRQLTPEFDKWSKRGLLFENAFATGTRTVRGLEAISTSLPPIPSESTVKRPGNEEMANLGELFKRKGYDSSFLYGGFGIFDNMNYFFRNNGFNISDRLDINPVTNSNIWGVCDENLFAHALKYFDDLSEDGRPFFSIIMTTSNHKPFTFPENIPGIPSSGGGREAGVRYADYALGKFLQAAKERSWFKNTLIVVVGDHDSRVYGKAYIPVERFRVALMMLAPEHIKPRVISNVTSQIDLAPTILGLLGLEYTAPFYGRDILDEKAPLSQPVLINHNHDVGLLSGDQLAVTGLNKSLKTFRYVGNDITRPAQNNLTLESDLTAYLQTAYELFRDKGYKL